jgi:hypothetical protein
MYFIGGRVALGYGAARLLGLWRIAVLTKKQTTIMELKMEFKILLVFVAIVGIAYVIYKMVEKKTGP